MIVPGSVNPLLIGGRRPSVSYLGQQTDSASKSSYSFTFSFGEASDGRIVAVAFALAGNADVYATSVTIGGISATVAVNEKNGGSGTALVVIAHAVVPTNADQTVSIALSVPKNYCSAAAYSIPGMSNSAHLYAGAANGANVSSLSKSDVNSASDGVLISASLGHTGPTSTTWTTGLTKDVDGVFASSSCFSSAHLLATSTENPKTVTASLSAAATSAAMGVVTFK